MSGPIFDLSEPGVEWLAVCYGVAILSIPFPGEKMFTQNIDTLGFIMRKDGLLRFAGRWKFPSGTKMRFTRNVVGDLHSIAEMIEDVHSGLVKEMGKKSAEDGAVWDLSSLKWGINPSGNGIAMVDVMATLPQFEMEITKRFATPEELAKYRS